MSGASNKGWNPRDPEARFPGHDPGCQVLDCPLAPTFRLNALAEVLPDPPMQSHPFLVDGLEGAEAG
jgi:hypothetical protein